MNPDYFTDLEKKYSTNMARWINSSIFDRKMSMLGVDETPIVSSNLCQEVDIPEYNNIVNTTRHYKKLIKDKSIRLPYDMKYDDIFLSSEVEPEFLDNLKEEYPEYFI